MESVPTKKLWNLSAEKLGYTQEGVVVAMVADCMSSNNNNTSKHLFPWMQGVPERVLSACCTHLKVQCVARGCTLVTQTPDAALGEGYEI